MKAAPQLAATVLALAAAGWGQSPRHQGNAAIVDSGSTNTNGFRIVVDQSGKTQSTVALRGPQARTGESPAATPGTIPAAVAERLYSDLNAAWPLSSLPSQHCLKSASFGTRLTIEFDGQTTPDLSCGRITDPKVKALARDAREIVATAGVKRSRVE